MATAGRGGTKFPSGRRARVYRSPQYFPRAGQQGQAAKPRCVWHPVLASPAPTPSELCLLPLSRPCGLPTVSQLLRTLPLVGSEIKGPEEIERQSPAASASL